MIDEALINYIRRRLGLAHAMAQPSGEDSMSGGGGGGSGGAGDGGISGFDSSGDAGSGSSGGGVGDGGIAGFDGASDGGISGFDGAGDGGGVGFDGAGDAGNDSLGGSVDGGSLGGDAGVDSMSPSYLVINPDGSVGAIFPGGVRLIEGTSSTPLAQAAIEFLDNVDKATLREYVAAWVGGGSHEVDLASNPDTNDFAIFKAIASVLGTPGTSLLQLNVKDNSGAAFQKKLLDTNGYSDFLANLTGLGGGPIGINGGVVPVHIGASTSGFATVTHSLGRTPIAVVATAQAVIGSLIAHTDTFTSTTFKLTLVISAATTNNFNASWLAIG